MKNTIIDALEWRYAVKKFDATKKISDTDLHILKESIRLTPTSYGLQSFQVIDVVSAEIREKLKSHSWNQTQITEASHLFVFTAQKNITSFDVDSYMENVSRTRKIELEHTKAFGNSIKGAISSLTELEFVPWNTKQTYIALGFLLQTAAELRVDATPIEGFDVAAYDEILGLSEKGLTASVICALGYRSVEDKNQFQAKVRKSTTSLFMTV
jgi:nitroreductase